MRRPIVRMIGQPPSVVPAVSAAPHASSAHRGDARCEVSPAATSNAATIPMDFCASFAPCVKARPPDMVHCPACTGPRASRGAACGTPPPAVDDKAGQKTRDGGQRQHAHHAQHPHRLDPLEPAPVHRTYATVDERGADQPAEQRVPGTRREGPPPGDSVPRHRTSQCRAEHEHHLVVRNDHNPRDRVSNRLPENERSDHIPRRREHDCRTRAGRTRRHERRDGVCGVVQAIGERKRQRHPNRDDQGKTHQQSLIPRAVRNAAFSLGTGPYSDTGVAYVRMPSGRRMGRGQTIRLRRGP